MAMPVHETKFQQRYTVAEFVKMPEYHERFELINGNIVAKPIAKYEHNHISRIITRAYDRFDPDEKLGEIGTEVSFHGGPDYAPVPELSYWQAGRTPNRRDDIAERPDIAIEIQSPGQSVTSLLAKAQTYLQAGVKLVWVIQITRPIVHVFTTPNTSAKLFKRGDVLDAGNIIPGFTLPVNNLYDL